MLEGMLQEKLSKDRVRITLFSREVAGKWGEEKKKGGGTGGTWESKCVKTEKNSEDRRGIGSEVLWVKRRSYGEGVEIRFKISKDVKYP